MSGYADQFNNMWNEQGAYTNQQQSNQFSYNPRNDMVLEAEELWDDGLPPDSGQQPVNQQQTQSPKMAFFYENVRTEPVQQQTHFQPPPVTKSRVETYDYSNNDFDNEPPLLEELGVEPEQIVKRVLVILDPFKHQVPTGDFDLAGPFVFCLALAVSMLLSGGKINFSYIYGIALTSTILMYGLLWVMTNGPSISVTCVASVLGYSLLPVVILSSFGIIYELRTPIGYSLAVVAILWSSIAASRIFVTMSQDFSQRLLIAYPCMLLYAVFTLLVLF